MAGIDQERGNALLGWVLIAFLFILALAFRACSPNLRVVHAQTPGRVYLPVIMRDAGPVTTSTSTTTTSTTSTTLGYPVINTIQPEAFSLSAGPITILTITGSFLQGTRLYMDFVGIFPLIVATPNLAAVMLPNNALPLSPGPIDLVCYLIRGETTSDLYFYSLLVLP